jgi:hypothetical protein
VIWKRSGGGVLGQAQSMINPLNAKLNPICHPLALLGAHPILHVRKIRVNFHLEAPKLSRWQLSIAVSTGVLYQQISI